MIFKTMSEQITRDLDKQLSKEIGWIIKGWAPYPNDLPVPVQPTIAVYEGTKVEIRSSHRGWVFVSRGPNKATLEKFRKAWKQMKEGVSYETVILDDTVE